MAQPSPCSARRSSVGRTPRSSPARANTPTTSSCQAWPYAVIVRSPYAHARDHAHRHHGGAGAAGRRRGLHRRGHQASGIAGHRPRRLAAARHEDPAASASWPATRCATSATASRWSWPRTATLPRDAARPRAGRLRAAASRRRPARKRVEAGAPQIHDGRARQHRLRLGARRHAPRPTRPSPRAAQGRARLRNNRR